MDRKGKVLGQRGENFAADYLSRQGYTIIARNVFCRYGEIDLIVRKDEVVACVEVKTRTHAHFPIAVVVTKAKQRKIIATAKWFMARAALVDCVIRFDIMTLCLDEKLNFEVTHVTGAFTP